MSSGHRRFRFGMPGSASCLVIETDGYDMAAASARRGRRGLELSPVPSRARVRPLRDGAEMAAEILSKPGPALRHAVVCTPEATAAVLRLPAALMKQPEDKIRAALLWDFSPVAGHRAGSARLGTVLVQAGVLTPEGFHRVQREAAPSDSGRGPRRRFGELAVEAGFADRGDIEEALARQEWLAGPDRDLQVAFRTLSARSSSGEIRVLACGMCSSRMDAWRSSLEPLGIRRISFLPPGLASAALECRSGRTNFTLLSVSKAQRVRISVEDGEIASVEIRHPDAAESEDAGLDDLLAGDGPVLLSGRDPERMRLRDRLLAVSGRESARLVDAGGEDPAESLLPIASMAFASRGAPSIPLVGTGRPRRLRIPRRVAVLVLLFIAVAAGLFIYDRGERLELVRAEEDALLAEKRWAVERNLQAELLKRAAAGRELIAKRSDLETRLARLRRERAAMPAPSAAGASEFYEVLDAVRRVADDAIVVSRLQRLEGGSLAISGRALDHAAVQAFSSRLDQALGPYGSRVAGISASLGRGEPAGGEAIYGFHLALESQRGSRP